MKIDFSDWLSGQMRKQGITQADLARLSGVTTGAISLILSGSRSVGTEAATSIAKALRLPPEIVFRAAGLLPPKPKDQADTEDLVYKFRLLDEARKAQLLDFIDYLLMKMETQPAAKTGEPMSDDEMVDAIKKIATRHGYSVQETDLAAMIKSSQKVKER